MRLKKVLLLLLVAFLVTNNTFCQNKYSNTFYFNKSFYYHYKSKTIDVSYFNGFWVRAINSLINGGVGYGFNINQTNSIKIMLNTQYRDGISGSFITLPLGTNLNRSVVSLQSIYIRNVFSKNKNRINLTSGLSFRVGNETLFAGFIIKGYYPGTNKISAIESLSISKKLMDLGLIIGVNYQYYFTERLVFNSRVNYTLYSYLFDTKDISYDWDPGPSRHVFQASVGLGFNFGKNQVK